MPGNAAARTVCPTSVEGRVSMNCRDLHKARDAYELRDIEATR